MSRRPFRSFMLSPALALIAFCYAEPTLAQQWTLDPASQSCTMASFVLGDLVLPNCTKSGYSVSDSLDFYTSARCTMQTPCALLTETLPTVTLQMHVGLNNGPCHHGVTWNFYGNVQPGGQTGSYVWANLNAQSLIAAASIAGSEDCNGQPFYTGPNNQNFACN